MAHRKALGKGLDALIQPAGEGYPVHEIPLSALRPSPVPLREELDEGALQELASSLEEDGVLQPILVRPVGNGGYQVVAGNRRVKAARLAGLVSVPAFIKDIPDNKVLTLALVENLQREDINPVEEALAYKYLNEDEGMSHEAIAAAVGKHRTTVTNVLRLLNLPERVLDLIRAGDIAPGHARALMSLDNASRQVALAERIAAEGLSVRQVEKAVKGKDKRERKPIRKDAFRSDLEKRIGEAAATKVRVSGSPKNGTIKIFYYSAEDLTRLLKFFHLEV